MKNFKQTSSLIFITLVFVACSSGEQSQPNIEIIQDMMESPGVKAQEGKMRVPPENTVPVGFTPYANKGHPEQAVNLKNPVAVTAESLAQGKKYYNIYCMVCHGEKGMGDGTVADKMLVKPPSLHSDKAKNWSDGSIYHVITSGQGVMGNYASQIYESKDRWAIVNYVRQLQKEK